MFKVKHEIFIKSSLNKLLRNNPEPKHQHVQAYRKYCHMPIHSYKNLHVKSPLRMRQENSSLFVIVVQR